MKFWKDNIVASCNMSYNVSDMGKLLRREFYLLVLPHLILSFQQKKVSASCFSQIWVPNDNEEGLSQSSFSLFFLTCLFQSDPQVSVPASEWEQCWDSSVSARLLFHQALSSTGSHQPPPFPSLLQLFCSLFSLLSGHHFIFTFLFSYCCFVNLLFNF